MGEKLGRLHMVPQDLSTMKVRKPKALRPDKRKASGEESGPSPKVCC